MFSYISSFLPQLFSSPDQNQQNHQQNTQQPGLQDPQVDMVTRRSARTGPAASAAIGAAAAAAPLPPSPPLDGLTIVLSGKFNDYGDNTQASMENKVRALGGSIAKSVTKTVTHVVCSGSDYHKNAAKVAAAKAAGLPLMSPDWILKMEHTKAKVDEKEYTFPLKQTDDDDEDDAKDNTQDTNGANGKKRPIAIAKADASDDEKADQPKTKKAKGAKATGKATGKAAKKDPEPEPEVKEEKQVAEGQFIKKKSTVIPVDEFCPLAANYQVYVDDDGMIWDASLNQSNASYNNNKFYRIQVCRPLLDLISLNMAWIIANN